MASKQSQSRAKAEPPMCELHMEVVFFCRSLLPPGQCFVMGCWRKEELGSGLEVAFTRNEDHESKSALLDEMFCSERGF